MQFHSGDKLLFGKPPDILQIIKITLQLILSTSTINSIISIGIYHYDYFNIRRIQETKVLNIGFNE